MISRGTVRERRVRRPDGRDVAWVEAGAADGRPILRVPGTPGSRLQLRPDQGPWLDRGLRMLVTERPGFGASSPDAALSWERHADDLAAILDAASVEKLPVIGGSGGAPYVLAFAARHPERVAAATIVSGAAPIQPAELPSLIELNAAAYLLARAGDRGGMKDLLEPQRLTRLDDPLAAVRMSMATAPTEDQTIMNDPAWQDMLTRGTREALRQGVDAWVDESMLMFAGWDVLDPTLVRSTVTWWHGADDRNCPVTAPMRLVDKIPSSQLRVWREAGHLTAYREEGTILDELLSRAG